jgi:pseudouridine kinase
MDFEFSPSPGSPVLVIGAAVQDIVGITRGNLNQGTSNPGKIRKSFGGVARNVAENLARLGQSVILLTVVGQDETGDSLLEYMRSAGVDVSFVLRHNQRSTGTYLALVNEKGRLQYALDDVRILSALTPDYLDLHSDLFSKAGLIFLDSNLNKEVIRKIFTLARASKVPVCADPTSILLTDRLKPYLSRIKLITPNILEAEILCGFPIDPFNRQEALDAAKCLVSSGVEISIITLAELGVCYATSETTGQVPALRTQVVDPTGGGDALTAAVIFALLNGIPLDDAIRLGISASSLTLHYSGTVVPDLSLEKLYDRLVI